MLTQCPTRNGFSTWMARPAIRLPRVSCSANPTTTAPTAVVANTFSCRMSVAAIANTTMMMASCTMFGRRSGSRSTRHELIASATTPLMTANVRTSGSHVCSCWTSSGDRRTNASAAAAAAYTPNSTAEISSLPRMWRFTITPRSASVTMASRIPGIRAGRLPS